MAIELSGLAEVTREQDRTRLMAWYNLFSCFAAATGALFCGVFISSLQSHGFTDLSCYKIIMILYAVCQAAKLVVFTLLSDAIEVPAVTSTAVKNVNPVSLFLGLHKSKEIVLKLSLLFMMDSFAGAFILQSLISAWFDNKYKTPSHELGSSH